MSSSAWSRSTPPIFPLPNKYDSFIGHAIYCMKNGDLDGVKKMFGLQWIKENIDDAVNAKRSGRSFFIWAVLVGNVEILEFLLEFPELNLSAVDLNNKTALEVAEMYKGRNPDILKCLSGFLSTRKKNIHEGFELSKLYVPVDLINLTIEFIW